MVEKTGMKKVVPIRTFADDVKRQQGVGGREADSAAPIEAPAKPPATKIAPAVSSPPPPKPATPEPNVEPASEPIFEENEPIEAPPFHSIRASSPDESSFTDFGPLEIEDKETLKKETVRQTAPPRIAMPSQAIALETESILDQPRSVHSNADGVFDTEEAIAGGGDGTIVLDRKRRKFRLIPAIAASLQKWFGTKRSAYVEARRPKKIVEKSERRKEVITSAARGAPLAPQDDFAGVAARLQNVERVTTRGDVQLKAPEVAIPRWDYVTDDEEAVHEVAPQADDTSTEEAPATWVSFNEPHAEETAPEETETEIEDVETQTMPQAPPLKEAPPEEGYVIPTAPRTVEESGGFVEYREKYGKEYNPREDTFDASLPLAPETPPQEDPTSLPQLNRQSVPEYRLERVGKPKKATSGTPILMLVVVVVTAVLLGVGSTIWWFTRNSSDETAITSRTAPSLINAASSVAIPLSGSRSALYSALDDAISRGGNGVAEFYPVLGGVSATPEDVFATLAFNAPSSMTRSVTQVVFGGQNGEVPFMLMKFTSFDTVFGGMLQWESQISQELAPLFGEGTVTTSIDSRINNRDVRVLIDDNGNDRIVYGFIDKNTLLITTNRNAYSAIAPQVK